MFKHALILLTHPHFLWSFWLGGVNTWSKSEQFSKTSYFTYWNCTGNTKIWLLDKSSHGNGGHRRPKPWELSLKTNPQRPMVKSCVGPQGLGALTLMCSFSWSLARFCVKVVELRTGNPTNPNPGSSPLNGPFLQSSTPEIEFSLQLWTETIRWDTRKLFSNAISKPSQIKLKYCSNLTVLVKSCGGPLWASRSGS